MQMVTMLMIIVIMTTQFRVEHCSANPGFLLRLVHIINNH